MAVSPVSQAARKPLSVPAVLPPRRENAVPRRQLTGPVRDESADRPWCAAPSSLRPPDAGGRRWSR
ncbi:hypothetical protein WJ438_37150 [Streptomyces sp. GD-15H]|uniref:hypothetical protein n=1 Tax=Streptomyces sp. GD-15H TaxID=3129112 RepID=UPI003252AD61